MLFSIGLDMKIKERKYKEARIRKKNIATTVPHSHQEAHVEMIPNRLRKGIIEY